MTKQRRLDKLVKAESILKQTQEGYRPDRPRWKIAMPMLWDVRVDLGGSDLGRSLAEAHGLLKQTEKGYDPWAPRWKQAMKLIDGVEAQLHSPPVPNLGPVLQGDKSVLLWVPTHNTDGLDYTGSHYPAFDSGFGETGRVVIAPERMRVRRQSSADGADAFYATGVSGIEWWFGHIVSSPATGRWFNKGDRVSTIARISAADGGPHLHVGMDCRRLIGRDLRWGRRGNGPDYTFGSPTIGKQLAAALAA